MREIPHLFPPPTNRKETKKKDGDEELIFKHSPPCGLACLRCSRWTPFSLAKESPQSERAGGPGRLDMLRNANTIKRRSFHFSYGG